MDANWNSLMITNFKNYYTYHGCARACLQVYRFSTSTHINLLMNSFAESLISSQYGESNSKSPSKHKHAFHKKTIQVFGKYYIKAIIEFHLIIKVFKTGTHFKDYIGN